MQRITLSALALTCLTTTALSRNHELASFLQPFHEGVTYTTGRPDGHAPIGVMGDHIHKEGEWMFSYRFMRMEMDGNRDGTDRLSPSEVLALGYMVTPTEMTMDMHMFGFMYAVSNDLTMMAMLPYVDISMDHLTGMGGTFTTTASGPGDFRLAGLYSLWEGERQRLHLNAGVSLPTGSINERDQTPASMGNDVQLPYPMQLGSGTFDLLPGLTYNGQSDFWSWGAQFIQTIRIDENSRDYRLGNRSDATVWGARRLGNSLSLSARLAGARWGNIHGADPALNPTVVPTADPNLRGGERVDFSLGLNFSKAGHRLAIEVGEPIYQDLDGPQLETDLIWTFGYQFSR